MNNWQFRKLVLDTPARQAGSGEGKPVLGATPRRDGATPSALGSRMRSSIPMTPRSVGGVDFARQLAEQRALTSSSSEQPQKKFRASKAPKGAKLAEGYIDRTRAREQQDEEDDRAQRVKALEEMMKLQQIDEATFIKLRDEILGGDISITHLVKGLDWKLLERVKRGEDVLNAEKKNVHELEGEQLDVDEEFDELENMEVQAVKREENKKKGEMASPSLIPGKKRNRDQILAQLKAARKAAQEAKGPSLGAKFKKVGERRAESRIERDSKGREVLITVDEHGDEKRKVRKIQVEPEFGKGHGLEMPDKDAKPLGMMVPEAPKVEDEEEDMDIFDNAGDDYNPLAGLEEDDNDFDAEDGEVADVLQAKKDEPSLENEPECGSMAPPPRLKQPAAVRNYFGESTAEPLPAPNGPLALRDPTILAALKKASTLDPLTEEVENEEEAAKIAKRKKMLQQDDRDAEDMDMGFGSSRFADEEDFEEKKVKLSEWGSKGDDDDESGKGDGRGKRKRGPKKRKGDGKNAADVMKVMEKRKAAG